MVFLGKGEIKERKIKGPKADRPVVKQKKLTGYARKAIRKAEPKVIENPKNAMFIRSTTANPGVMDAMKDIFRLKKPCCKMLAKKNNIRPFDELNSLEFLSQKNECSLFLLGSHSKKRPMNMIMGRFYNYQLLDMIELGVLSTKSIEEFTSMKSQVGQKPMFIFQSDLWQYSEKHMLVKNLLLDFFNGHEVESINLAGMSYVISVTAIGNETEDRPKIFFRVYSTQYTRVAGVAPRVDLVEMGPSLDLEVRRIHENTTDLKKQSMRVPRGAKAVKVKNVSHNVFGEKIGRVHMTSQTVDKMQLRKIKALKILRKEKKLVEKGKKEKKERRFK